MNKSVVIVGKGPTAHEIKANDSYSIAAVNNSTILVDGSIDYLFVNDYEAYQLIPKEDFVRVKNIILPRMVHIDKQPKMEWDNLVSELVVEIPGDIDIKIHTHILDTDPDKHNQMSSHEYLGRSFSVTTTALQWLARYPRDYKNVMYMGIDSEGGYNPIFELKDDNGNPINHACRPEPIETYQQNYNYFLQIGEQYNINLSKI